MQSDTTAASVSDVDIEPVQAMTIEAYADTIIPGERRFPGDRVCAGAAPGGGAVAAGALELLTWSAGGLAEQLGTFAFLLDMHATEYAAEHDLTLDDEVPPFVALDFEHRTALVRRLTDPEHPEKQIWVGLALFSNMAYDSAAHLSTPDALAAGHPGLLAIGYAAPDAEGLWRFPRFSYGRQLAPIHPNTTPTGSPA